MVGYLGPARSPADLLFHGTHSLEHQSHSPRELLHGTVNVDGYGVAWYPEDPPGAGAPVRIAEARPIWHDPDLEPLLRTVRARAALAAIRNTTPGIPTDRTGVAPLTSGPWAFVLNGFIQDFRRTLMRPLHSLLPNPVYQQLQGGSDTEALFLLLQTGLREGLSLSEATARVVHRTLELGDGEGLEIQLNMVTCDGRTLVATRAGTEEEQNSLYVRNSGFSEGDGGFIVASEALDDESGWQPVPPGTLVTSTLDGGARIEPLASIDDG